MPERKLMIRFLELSQEKERQEKRRITNRELARELNITEHTVANWKAGTVTKVEMDIAQRICNYFNCEVGDLFVLE
jgi:DNA-binding Xre family transcriptional regulator